MGILERLRRYWWTHGSRKRFRTVRSKHERIPRKSSIWLTSLIVSLLLAAIGIVLLELRLRPMAVTIAQAQAQNTISSRVEQTIVEDLAARELSYDSFVTIQRDPTGAIISLTTNMAAMNQLRGELVSRVLNTLDSVDVSEIQIPLGSLLDLNLLWGHGPTMNVHAMAVGTVDAEFVSEFSSAGVNQTLHQIYLEFAVPITLMLPGGPAETISKTRLCVAETVIVGHVPDTYLQFAQP